MKKIILSSKDNEKIKVLKKLGTKKYRNKWGKFLVENLATLYDALRAGKQPESLFITEKLLNRDDPRIKFILENLKIEGVFVINEDMNKYFSNLENPEGIVAVYKKEEAKEIDSDKDVLYLNGIKDPGNLGTILRSAVAFGVSEIVIDEECVDLYNPKTIQSSKDAIFKLNIVFDKRRSFLSEMNKNIEVFITDVEGGESVSSAFKNKDKFCVVLGSESHGVSDDIKKFSNKTINIKSDPEMESLNVAVSAGIILYEVYSRK